MMTKPDFEKWVAALRSGEYRQVRGKLKSYYEKYCCLGVAVEIGVANPRSGFVSNTGLEYGEIPGWFELELAQMNDSGEADFDEIADWIEGIAAAEFERGEEAWR